MTIPSITCAPIRSDSVTVVPAIQRVPEFLKYAAWFGTPRQFREPETQKEFAKAVGVCEDTLTDWKRHPNFWPLVQASMHEWIKERIPDVVGALHEKILAKGNAREAEMFFRLGGMEVKKPKK